MLPGLYYELYSIVSCRIGSIFYKNSESILKDTIEFVGEYIKVKRVCMDYMEGNPFNLLVYTDGPFFSYIQ